MLLLFYKSLLFFRYFGNSNNYRCIGVGFSTGGRVLDPYRTNLSYAVVEALICTQDWVRKSKREIIDDIDDLLNDDDVAKGNSLS